MTQLLEDFIRSGVTSIPADHNGEGWRCSAVLGDGTTLPCVMLRRRKAVVDLAVRRLAEESRGKGVFGRLNDPYRDMLAHFVTKGNRVNDYDITEVTPSRYAIPLDLLEKIQGETVMSWTGFVLEMNDGQRFAFGTTFLFAFFNLPEGYEFSDVRAVHNHSYVGESGELLSIRGNQKAWFDTFKNLKVYREKPYFDCFLKDA